MQITDSPIVNSIGENYRPMRQRRDSFEIAAVIDKDLRSDVVINPFGKALQNFSEKGSFTPRTITNINLLLVKNNSSYDLL